MNIADLPKTMRAFMLTGHGDMDKLVYKRDWPVPELNDNDVLIKVHACGLNNTDVNTRLGWYSKGVGNDPDPNDAKSEDAGWGGTPLRFPRIQGADVVGTVVARGKNAPAALMGCRVMVDTWLRDWDKPNDKYGVGYYGSEADGGFADYTKIDYRNVHKVQSDLSHAELASFATAWMTAEGMLNRAQVKADDKVLVTGASGGVGSALISLCKLRRAHVTALTSARKVDAIKSLGADHVLIRGHDEIPNQVFDVVADVVAGELFPDLINALLRGGTYVTSGAIGGPLTALDIRTLYLHDLTLLGSTIVPAGTFDALISYINQGLIKPILAAQYKLEDLHSAQQAFIDKAHTGNIVVTMD